MEEPFFKKDSSTPSEVRPGWPHGSPKDVVSKQPQKLPFSPPNRDDVCQSPTGNGKSMKQRESRPVLIGNMWLFYTKRIRFGS